MPPFDMFVVLAEMRTGSNFLEANLNALDGVACLGELFNPAFVGHPGTEEVLGFSQAGRDADPMALVEAVRRAPGLTGFRFFNDHDPRVLPRLLADPRCAKIVLTRNPVESWVSLKIAAATGQWKLTNARHARSQVVQFDGAGFERHLEERQEFQLLILRALQTSGQTAFYVDYEDLQDLEVTNGLAAWLGVEARLEALDRKLKKQNPEPLETKVANYEEMAAALARLDRFNLSRTPNFEPRRGPALPTWVAAAQSPLLYLPLKGGPEAAVRDWMTRLDAAAPADGMKQPQLRQWRRRHPGARSFAVLRHPVARAHAALCEKILATGPGSFAEIRQTLARSFGLPLPEEGAAFDAGRHREALLRFLAFAKANLGGQTNLRVDGHWASQTAVLSGMTGLAPPDHLFREAELAADLPWLAARLGREAPELGPTDPWAERLAAVYDGEVEAAARDAYGRDYESFGFGNWQ